MALTAGFLGISPASSASARAFRSTTWTPLTVAGAAIVVAVFAFFLPRIADYRDVLDVVRGLGWQEWLLLAGATILNLVTFPPPWMAEIGRAHV